MLRLVRWAAVVVACAGGVAPARAARGARPIDGVATGVIEQLAAGRELLFALREGAVLMFDRTGALIGRCGRSWAPPGRGRSHGNTSRDTSDLATDILRDARLPDDDSTLASEELVEEEAGSERIPRRRATSPSPSVLPRALAALGRQAWAATTDGVYRVMPGGCQRIGLPGRDLLSVAAGATVLAAASADILFRAETQPVDRDAADQEAWSFRPIAALATPPRALAVDPRGAVLVAGERGLIRVEADGTIARLLDRPTHALTTCGERVAVLADDGVYTWDGRTVTRAGDRPPARLLACGVTAPRWLAGGPGLWTSVDAVLWTAHDAALGVPVAALAVFDGRAWVASDDGLMSMDLGAPAASAVRAPPPLPPVLPLKSVPVPATWWWPQVSVVATVDRRLASASTPTSTRQAVSAFVMLRFPFGRPPPPGGDAAVLALARARRAAALVHLQVTGAGTADPVDLDELGARRELAADEGGSLQ